MKRVFQLCLGGTARPVGTLRYAQDGSRQSVSFEYAQAWLSDDYGFALEPALPLVRGPKFHAKSNSSVFHAAIADMEPDGLARRVISGEHAT